MKTIILCYKQYFHANYGKKFDTNYVHMYAEQGPFFSIKSTDIWITTK